MKTAGYSPSHSPQEFKLTASAPLKQLEPYRIMVAEDDRELREFLAAKLREYSYLVMEAGDGKAALALALGIPPDLIVVDYGMPELNGFELLPCCACMNGHVQCRPS